MRLKLMESMVSELKKQFIDTYPGATEPIARVPVVMVPRKTTKAIMNRVVEKVGAPSRKHHRSSISGEFITGKNGNAVMIYQMAIQSEEQFVCTLFHELGHVLDDSCNSGIIEKIRMATDKAKSEESKNNDILSCGYRIWSEFIADSLMYRVIKSTLNLSLLWGTSAPAKEHLASQAEHCFGKYDFSIRWMHLYEIGQYFALALYLYGKEDHIEASDEELGLGICNPEIAGLVREMLDILCKQLAGADFWKVTECTLKYLGQIYEDMKLFYSDKYSEDGTGFMCIYDFDEIPFY